MQADCSNMICVDKDGCLCKLLQSLICNILSKRKVYMNDPVVNIKPFAYTIGMINGKWKMHILFWLWKKEVMRYGELKRSLGKVTHKMLRKSEPIGAAMKMALQYKKTGKGIRPWPYMQSEICISIINQN